VARRHGPSLTLLTEESTLAQTAKTRYRGCPQCGQRVALRQHRRELKDHYVDGQRCPGSGTAVPPPRQPTGPAAEQPTKTQARTLIVTVLSVLSAVITIGGLAIDVFSRPHGARGDAQLVSSDGEDVAADQDSGRPTLDASGRYVAFTSSATNLSPLAPPRRYSVYRKDLRTRAVDLASQGARGTVANGDAQFPVICASGRYVAFASTSTNLLHAARQASSYRQVYVHDELTHQTTLVSTDTAGEPGNGESDDPTFSANCRHIAFTSQASDLVARDDNGVADIFVRDLVHNATTRVSVADNGGSLNASSANAEIDGPADLVAFTSWASDLPEAWRGRPAVYVRDLRSMRTFAVSAAFSRLGTGVRGFAWPSFSPDGRYVLFRSLTNAQDLNQRGRFVAVWDVRRHESAITGADGKPAAWADDCTTGVNNGTRFSPAITGATRAHSYLVLFTSSRNGICTLVLRDLQGNEIPLRPEVNRQEVAEPAINQTARELSWVVDGHPKLIYACAVADCKG
jgi:hypothetical protein